jgi:hypothetical protein
MKELQRGTLNIGMLNKTVRHEKLNDIMKARKIYASGLSETR